MFHETLSESEYLRLSMTAVLLRWANWRDVLL